MARITRAQKQTMHIPHLVHPGDIVSLKNRASGAVYGYVIDEHNEHLIGHINGELAKSVDSAFTLERIACPGIQNTRTHVACPLEVRKYHSHEMYYNRDRVFYIIETLDEPLSDDQCRALPLETQLMMALN